MFSDERSKYKSWNNIKKQMNDLLCDALKDKISYFYTTYREVHDTYGRATINYKRKELLAFSWQMRYEQWEDEYKILNNSSVDIQHLSSLSAVWEKQKQIQQDLSKEKWMPECIPFAVFTHVESIFLLRKQILPNNRLIYQKSDTFRQI